MSLISTIIDPLLHLHGPAAYALVAVLVFGEAALFVGFVLPGETAVILGGVLAYRHSVSLTVMVLVVVAAAIVGDSVGYEVGKRYGNRVLASRMFARYQNALNIGRNQLRKNGGRAVLISRFTAFLRAVMPGMAGTSEMPYRKFLLWNAAGGVIWGAGFTILGYLAGASYKTIEDYAGKLSYVVLAGVAVILIVFAVRRHRNEKDPVSGSDDESADDAS